MAQVVAGPSVVVGVGQIVEDDRLGQAEHFALAAEEGGFEGLAVEPEQVADAVELGQGQGQAGFEAEQFEGGAALGEPGVGLVLILTLFRRKSGVFSRIKLAAKSLEIRIL